MDEAARVLARLTRIDELRREQLGDAAPGDPAPGDPAPDPAGTLLLDELRALVPEAEAWARAEGDVRARTAATKLRGEAEGMD